MNSRIYSEAIFAKAIADLKNKLLHCPKCYNNNISNKEDNIIYMETYKCFDCEHIFDKGLVLSKSDARDKKIKRVLDKNNK